MPYFKRNQDCTNKSGKKGKFVTIKKSGGERKCWKSKAAFERSQAASYAQAEDDRNKEDELIKERLVRELIHFYIKCYYE